MNSAMRFRNNKPDFKEQLTSGILGFSDGPTNKLSELPDDALYVRKLCFLKKDLIY